MGNLSQSVRTLVEDITAATHNRQSHLQALTAETREARRQCQAQLQEMGQALTAYFTSNRAQRAAAAGVQRQATQQLMGEIRRVHEERRVTVSELRSDAYNSIKRFGLERQDMARTVRERLTCAGQALQEAVQEIRHAAQETVDGIVADRRQAHQHWTERGKKKITPEVVAAATVVAEAAMTETTVEVEAPSARHDARPLPLEERVLEVITRHPEGIRLVDIGNDLGVDWRSLLGISRTIVEEDKVERIDNRYYPRGEGPHEAGEEA